MHWLINVKGNYIMKLTKVQLDRIQRDYHKIAGELIQVEQINDIIYCLGSELATLLLFRKMPTGRQDYSQNLKSFYFSLDLS